MFPNKVYYCPCVSLEIKLCLVNGHYSLKDICKKLNQKVDDQEVDDRKIYCSKCGDDLQDVIFSCAEHMNLVIFSIKEVGAYIELDEKVKNSCKYCLKKYLKAAYHCCYDHTNFDVPITIKKEKKVLCLRIAKCNFN